MKTNPKGRQPLIERRPIRLDTEPDLFRSLNGTVDLRNGSLREDRIEDWITQQAVGAYVPGFKSALWEDFVFQVANEDAALYQFLQVWFGYCLTGSNRERKLAVFCGAESTEVDLMVSTVQEVMGANYALQATVNGIVDHARPGGAMELSRLIGKRLAVYRRSGDRMTLDDTSVKQLAGCVRIRGKLPYESIRQHRPTHKAVLIGDQSPAVCLNNQRLWRRILFVPFTSHFWDAAEGELGHPRREFDMLLPDKLVEEWHGVLGWMIEGAQFWYRHGLPIPPSVVAAGKACRLAASVKQAEAEPQHEPEASNDAPLSNENAGVSQ